MRVSSQPCSVAHACASSPRRDTWCMACQSTRAQSRRARARSGAGSLAPDPTRPPSRAPSRPSDRYRTRAERPRLAPGRMARMAGWNALRSAFSRCGGRCGGCGGNFRHIFELVFPMCGGCGGCGGSNFYLPPPVWRVWRAHRGGMGGVFPRHSLSWPLCAISESWLTGVHF